VAVLSVELREVLPNVATQLLLVVRTLAEPEEALFPRLHDAAETIIRKGFVPFERDLRDRDALALDHIEDEAVRARPGVELLQPMVDRAGLEALARQRVADHRLPPGDPRRLPRRPRTAPDGAP